MGIEKAILTERPHGDFSMPASLDEASLRFYIPMYLHSFASWAEERMDMTGKATVQARTFDYYLKTAFERVSSLGLADDPELAKLREDYRKAREKASSILALEDIAA